MDSSPTGCSEVIGKRKFLIAQRKIMTAHGVAPWAVLYIRKIVVDSWLFWLY